MLNFLYERYKTYRINHIYMKDSLKRMNLNKFYIPLNTKLHLPNTDEATKTFINVIRHLKQRIIKVFNATRGGKLEVIDRLDFDSLFEGGYE